MLRSITILLVFQSLGEVLSHLWIRFIPGPVIGMMLLLLFLRLRPAEVERLRATAQELLSHLSLLFIPAGVGIMVYVNLVARQWLPIAVALVLGTALTLGMTGWTIRFVEHLRSSSRNTSKEEPRQ